MAKEVVEVDLFNEVVARNLYAIREEKGLSQKKLAELSGIDNAIISRIEKQGYSKKVDEYYIQQLANTLGVDEDAITESNPRILALIALLDKEVHKVPASDTVIAASEELVTSTQNRGPKEKALAFLYHGLIWYYKGQYARATEEYEKAFHFAQISRVELLVRRVQRNLASALMMIGMYGRSEEMIRTILEQTPEHAVKDRAEDLFKLASLYRTRGDMQRSKETFLDILSFTEGQKECDAIRASSMQALGFLFTLLGQFELSIDFSNQAINLATLRNDPLTVLYAMRIIGNSQRILDQKENAIVTFTNGLSLAEKIGREYEILVFRFEIAATQNCYEKMREIGKNFDEVDAPPYQLITIYEICAEKAYELKNIDDLYYFTQKTNELLKKK